MMEALRFPWDEDERQPRGRTQRLPATQGPQGQRAFAGYAQADAPGRPPAPQRFARRPGDRHGSAAGGAAGAARLPVR